MRLWHLLVRQVSKSDNPANLIILKILVQTTARGQSTQSTPNTRVVFVPTLWEGNLSVRFLSALKTPPTSIYGTKLTPKSRNELRYYERSKSKCLSVFNLAIREYTFKKMV